MSKLSELMTPLLVLLPLICVCQAQTSCSYYENLEPSTTYYIYNEGLPHNYTGLNLCTWQMQSPAHYTTTINCAIVMPPAPLCAIDALIVSYAHLGYPWIAHYCGHGSFEVVVPPAISNIPHVTTVSFRSSLLTPGGNFLCEVNTSDDPQSAIPAGTAGEPYYIQNPTK